MTNRSAAAPRGPLAWPALGERQRFAFSLLSVLAGIAAVVLLFRLPPHAHEPRFVLALACLPLAFLRRWPLPVLALSTATIVVVMGSGSFPAPLGLMLGVAGYTVASRLPRRLSIRAVLLAVLALGVALAFVAATTGTTSFTLDTAEGLLPLAAAWFIGDSVAARRRYLAGLSAQAERERISEAEQARRELTEERVRIARELHDVIAHGLTVITVQAGVGRRLMAKRPEEAASALESIEAIGRTAQEELRVVLGLLRDGEVRQADLTPAPRLSDLAELAETVRAAGTPVDLHVSDDGDALSAGFELSVYRVIQEALTNVVKHAPGAAATVDLAVSAREARITVTDDGAGPARRPPGPAMLPGPPGCGLGLAGMRERVGAFGGSLRAEPAAGGGFRVTARIPLQDHM